MCVHMCIINLHVHGLCIWIFIFPLLFLVLKMTASLCLYPIIRFNKADWFYLQSIPREVDVPYKTALSHGLLTGFTDWYMYVYMYCWERRRCRVTIRFYNFREKWLGHDTLNFYSFCFIFHLEVAWSLHIFHLWQRGKTTSFKKTSIMLFWY